MFEPGADYYVLLLVTTILLTWKVKIEVSYLDSHGRLRLDLGRPQEPFPSSALSTFNDAWGINLQRGILGMCYTLS